MAPHRVRTGRGRITADASWVEPFVAPGDVVEASDEDVVWLRPDRTVEESADAWRSLGPALVVRTGRRLPDRRIM